MAKIVLIEDDRQFRAMLKQMLERAAHEVFDAESGTVGLELCKEQGPDLLVLDMMIPGQDGLEVLGELRKEQPNLKVIAISGGLKGDTSWLKPIAEGLGVEIFLEKPFSRTEIIEAIEQSLAD